jgi:hypothetical protein
MGFFSRLFKSSPPTAQKPSSPQGRELIFQIPWCSELRGRPVELSQPMILVSDVGGITTADIARMRQSRQQLGHPLLLLTPGVDPSIRGQLGGDLTAVQATDLPEQPLRDLLEDVAVVTGATLLSKELGFGLSFPDSLGDREPGVVFVPRQAWEEVSLHELGKAKRVTIDEAGTTLQGTPQESQLRAWTENLLRQTALPGREARLRRLGVAAPDRPTEADATSSPVRDEPLTFQLGSASRYFITDPQAGVCLIEDARVAVFANALTDLPGLVRLLGTAARSGKPLLLAAPSVSAEALAVCVTNRLRGVLQCVVAVPPGTTAGVSGVLADLARETGAEVITQGELRWETLGRARRICATSDEFGLTPAEDLAHGHSRTDSPSGRRDGVRSDRSARVPPGPSVTVLEFSKTALHLRGEFAGNLDLSLKATDPLPVQDVLDNLRVRMPGRKKLLSVAGYCEIAGGWQVTVYSEWAPPGRDLAASEAPATAEVLWLKHSRREPLVQVTVTHVLDDG